MRFRSGVAGIAASGDIGKSVFAPTERCGALVAQRNRIQAGFIEADREVYKNNNRYHK